MDPKGPEGEKLYKKEGGDRKIYRLWEHELSETGPIEKRWLDAYLSFKEVSQKLIFLTKEFESTKDKTLRAFTENRISAFEKRINELLDELKKLKKELGEIKKQ